MKMLGCSLTVRGTPGWGSILAVSAVLLSSACSPGGPPLRYKFESGHEYAYEVKIVATFPDAIETREGVSSLTAKSASDAEFTLRHSGNLAVRRENTGPARPFSRPDFGTLFPWGDNLLPRAGEFTLTAAGKITKAEVGTPLPYLLGDLEFLSLEEFPQSGGSKWEQKHEIVISERERSRFPRPPSQAAADGVKRSAHETVTFSARQTTGDIVHITKQYALRSDEVVDGNPKYQMTGEGNLEFDVKRGVFVSQAMKYTLAWNDKNVAVKIPVTVDCRLLNASELEQRQEAAKAAQAAALEAAAKANEPKPLQAGERDKLLRDLKSRSEGTVQAAAERLAKAPASGDAEAFATALTPLLSDRNSWIHTAAAKALVNWATINSAPALRKAVGDNDLWLRKAAMEALARFPSEENAQAIAARLVELGDRGDAVKNLATMGAVAEPAVLTYLKDRDSWVRLEACKLLGRIGTAKSLSAIEEFGADGQGLDKQESEKAIQAIRARSSG